MKDQEQHTPKEVDARQERKRALEHARALSLEIQKRRKGIPLPDITQLIEQMREERVQEIINIEKP